MLKTVVWGTGNMGRAGIRAVAAHPGLALDGVIVSNPEKVGVDAAELSGLTASTGVCATADAGGVLASSPDAVAYMASGDIRPDEALDDICRCLAAGSVVVTPALYPLYDPRNAPAELRARVDSAIAEGGGRLFVSGIDPGWGNDILPVLISGVASTIDSVRCREIFDYSTYDQPDAVRFLVGMGQPMDETPPMVAPEVPTMVWGGQINMMAKALGVELDGIDEHVERRPLETSVNNSMGTFEAGTQGALRFEVRGMVDGAARIVIEHVTRIDDACAPDWPTTPDGGAGSHQVIIEGRPRIVVSIEATDEDDSRAAGGNATAAGRLVNAIEWLHGAEPGHYDAFDVPLTPVVGKLGASS